MALPNNVPEIDLQLLHVPPHRLHDVCDVCGLLRGGNRRWLSLNLAVVDEDSVGRRLSVHAGGHRRAPSCGRRSSYGRSYGLAVGKVREAGGQSPRAAVAVADGAAAAGGGLCTAGPA
eukprot:scaffold349283_cov47-Prasinocladus_malaysianus.AAC.1